MPAKRKTKVSPNEQVTCPECGEKFWNTKALGGHRHWKHGIRVKSTSVKRDG